MPGDNETTDDSVKPGVASWSTRFGVTALALYKVQLGIFAMQGCGSIGAVDRVGDNAGTRRMAKGRAAVFVGESTGEAARGIGLGPGSGSRCFMANCAPLVNGLLRYRTMGGVVTVGGSVIVAPLPVGGVGLCKRVA